ncbi:related to armadillo repeat protein [Cephalotrichum gorgonifer]|uniref:Related to armadillo repeat protein n=1 Tax=Cephalotrichum gorgonifer TaxID=2041049 RepID=A0AAE8N106_9PEZI|nr:related to armadillo repeat protein [Cephalotrichum gorgonifer]
MVCLLGGPSFLAPIHATGALGAILGNISPSVNSPQIVHASLRALTVLADSAAIAGPGSPCDLKVLADSLFTPTHIHSMHTVLTSSSPDQITQAQITLTAGLINCLCTDDGHRLALAKPNGILDALATRLASFVVADGLVIPGAECLGNSDGDERIPEPAPRSAKLAPILQAIATIISDSKYRAFVLLTSPAIVSVFPALPFTPSPAIRATWQPIGATNATRNEDLSAMDYLLPAVPPQRTSRRLRQKSTEARDRKSTSGSMVPDNPSSESNGHAQEGVGETDGLESPLIPYLIHLSRSTGDDIVRLMAISVLTPLVRADFVVKPVRGVTLSLLVVPTLLQLIRDHLDKQNQDDSRSSVNETTRESWVILEHAPVLLARLIVDNENLQHAAFECGAVETLVKLIQEAYKPAVPSQPRMWSPHADTGMDKGAGPASSKLGQAGVLPLLMHRIRLRESALKAIAASSAKEEYSKAFAELDAVPYIFQSLSQFPEKPGPPKDSQHEAPQEANPVYGENPASVIIAACHTVRMLSRSVGILRTSLVDFSVGTAILKFMQNADIDIQIAATAAMANLVTDVSPMKAPLIQNHVMKILCEHTRSSNASLRLNALWALKHLVLGVGTSMKKSTLEELEPGLLVRLILDDTEDNALVSSRAGVESSGFDTDDTMDEDVDMQPEEEQKGFVFGTGTGGEETFGRGRSRQAEDRLARYREAEVNPVRKARHDDLAIQEQGLNFIRNLITGTRTEVHAADGETETTQMIDYLFSEVGQDRLFSILESKLRHKVIRPFSRRSSSHEARTVYPQPKIVEAVVYILVHMAASAPRHRQLVITQTNILKQLGTYFGNKDKDVRVALCHLVANLTWQDDVTDASGCRQRAQELKRLGFLNKLEGLREEDKELDVRERAKAALWQMKQPH